MFNSKIFKLLKADTPERDIPEKFLKTINTSRERYIDCSYMRYFDKAYSRVPENMITIIHNRLVNKTVEYLERKPNSLDEEVISYIMDFNTVRLSGIEERYLIKSYQNEEEGTNDLVLSFFSFYVTQYIQYSKLYVQKSSKFDLEDITSELMYFALPEAIKKFDINKTGSGILKVRDGKTTDICDVVKSKYAYVTDGDFSKLGLSSRYLRCFFSDAYQRHFEGTLGFMTMNLRQSKDINIIKSKMEVKYNKNNIDVRQEIEENKNLTISEMASKFHVSKYAAEAWYAEKNCKNYTQPGENVDVEDEFESFNPTDVSDFNICLNTAIKEAMDAKGYDEDFVKGVIYHLEDTSLSSNKKMGKASLKRLAAQYGTSVNDVNYVIDVFRKHLVGFVS